jgi:DNA polymerase III sliding clamp (beta) subunit (PCNA family)
VLGVFIGHLLLSYDPRRSPSGHSAGGAVHRAVTNVVPKDRKDSFAVEKAELLEVLRQVKAVVNQEAPSCMLSVEKGTAKVSVEDDGNTVYERSMEGAGKGSVELQLNPFFLFEALHPSWEVVKVLFKDAESSVLIRGDEPGAAAVVMPLGKV